jgi:RNA polymerase sigma-70 factor, ECF subfamily
MHWTEKGSGVNRELRGECGNTEEFESVISHHLLMFYRKAYQHLGNVHDAEDAVQDALLSAYKNFSQFRGQARLSTWLTTIVVNAARMQLRRRLNLPHVALDEQLGKGDVTLAQILPDCRPGPEELCRASELHQRFSQLTKRLSAALRKPLQLRVMDGLSTTEISQRVGVPEGTVKAQIYRARTKLARCLCKATTRARSLEAAGQRRSLPIK